MEAIRGVQLRKFKLRKIILGVRMHFRHNKSNMWYMIYSQIMPPPSPFASKSGGVMTPQLLWERRPWFWDFWRGRRASGAERTW